MLIRGGLLFTAVGLMILFGVLSVEYFLWLGTLGRFLLLFLGLTAQSYLLFRFILTPLFYLFKFRRGISNKQASLLIGRHFPEVGDKLYNLLDLAEDNDKSELLLASMEQRSIQLAPVPFTRAVDYREAWKSVRFLLIPVSVFLTIWFLGDLNGFFGSYERVINYNTAYQPPAPFVFETLMGGPDVLENETYTVQVTTRGTVKPESVNIHINGRDYILQEDSGTFYYTFKPPLKSAEFYFSANGIISETFKLNAIRVPAIEDFVMKLDYPSYLNRGTDSIRSTGNAVFPEGTRVQWNIQGKNTGAIHLKNGDSVLQFVSVNGDFRLSRNFYQDFAYQIITSNEHVEAFEVLSYEFKVIRDAYPVVKVKEQKDSLAPGIGYYSGEASDDYRIKSVGLVVYPEGFEEESQILELKLPEGNYEQFYYTFPSGLQLEEGKNYEFYFTATDNDALRGGKSGKSQVFRMRILDEREARQQQLQSQQNLIGGMNRTLDSFREENESYENVRRLQREAKELNYNEQMEIRDFLQRQKDQEEMMEKFSRKLKENLAESDEEEALNQLLQERLERRELEARKNAGLLEELKKVADKIDKDELGRRLEELGKQRQRNERSLEQLLELTKRYYVTEKAAELARDLEKLANKQTRLGEQENRDSVSARSQAELNRDFDNSMKELDTLRSENKDLKKPLGIEIEDKDVESVKEEQQKALDDLENEESEQKKDGSEPSEGKGDTQTRQKEAGRKISKMSEQLQQSASAGGGESGITEDAEMLRQILDNLITFSFKQERLFERMEREGAELKSFNDQVREQRELRELFGHIDDSLFALSLRRAEISELVNEQITEVYYNADKALESIAENRVYQGISHQQYVLTAANTLADFLAALLDNMQQSLGMGSGQGSGGGFQLPDIIKAQGQLKEKIGESDSGKKDGPGKEGQSPGKKGEGEQGDGKGEGQDGQGSGENGGEGTEGNGGQLGQSEGELSEIYEIYKEQQKIRTALEKHLADLISEGDKQLAQRILKQMERFESELLKSGITEHTVNRLNSIEHELLQMENAALKQGQKKERESETNRRRFANPLTTRHTGIEVFKDEVDILNRQALPLRQVYQLKVRDYFREDD